MSEKKQVHAIHRAAGAAMLPALTIWFFGRGLDPPFQYLLYTRGWAIKALSAVGLHGNNMLLKMGPGLGELGPIPTLVTGMCAAATLRHFYWIAFTNTYEFPVSQAIMIVVANLFCDTVNTFSAARVVSTSPPVIANSFIEALGWQQWAGIGLFISGVIIETVAEGSRTRFKSDPANKGKVDGTGLWSVVRHPNYAGYTCWRTGFALATGSIGAALAIGGFQLFLFLSQSIPELSEYMLKRYGEQWSAYEKRVPYKLFPGIL